MTLSTKEAERLGLIAPKRANKFKAKAVVIDGIRFDSTAEGNYYRKLQRLQEHGDVGSILRQPEFPLYAKDGGCVGKYRADFQFFDRRTDRHRTVDVKGFDTPLSRWKRKHVKEQYGIDVEILRG